MAKKESKIHKKKKGPDFSDVDKIPVEGSAAVASLCALVLNRLQDKAQGELAGSETTVKIRDLNEIFGEALEQFS